MYDLETLEEWIDDGAIDVPQGEWDMAVAPDRLLTTGLGPCTGILVHSPRLKTAVLAHLVDPRFEGEHFAELLKFIREGMGDVLGLGVYLGGAGTESEDRRGFRECEHIRKYVVNALMGLGIQDRQIRKFWGGLNESTTMAVDAESGEVLHIIKDYSDLMG